MSEPTRTSIPEPDGVTRTAAPDAADGNGAITAPPGYELLDEIGSGGMGVVYRARDLELAREVAVKILQPRYAPDSPTARRFVEEARITGRLQHPGIPAIYRVGTLADGRPFLAMKLIGGRTLDVLLKAQADPAAAEPGRFLAGFEQVAHGWLDRLDAFLQRGRLLAVFEQVAQAVGYAHQQGVIHRDLKPSNVMVGAFGEVQVMDWGIARSGDRRQETEPGGDATADYAPGSGSGTPQSDLTQAGAILGTPAFMPPEQAIGAVDQIGKHSDVFGLGAILCVILTGKPPYAAEDAESNRRLAARAKLDDCFARLDACGAEPELVALAKRCLAAEPSDRPRHAGEVADAVAALRAAAERRAREAEVERARAEVQGAEERKRRRVKRALTAAVVGLAAVAGLAGWWIDREQSQRRAEKQADELRAEADRKNRQLAYERDVKAALDEVHSSLRVGREESDNPARWILLLGDASSAVERAHLLLERGEPTDELRAEFDAATTAWRLDLRDFNLILDLDRAADGNEIRMLLPVSFNNVTPRQFAAAFRAHGIDLLAVPTDEAVAWLKAHRLRDRLVASLRAWRHSYRGAGIEGAVDARLLNAVGASAALAGAPVVAAGHHPGGPFERALRQSGPHAKLGAILKAVTEDDFARRWWNAVERQDAATLRKLVEAPEIGRMSSRELSALAEGLDPFGPTHEVLGALLAKAHERFPGAFWVHFRLASLAQFNPGPPDPEDPKRLEPAHRHLTAALAVRPDSAIARAALGANALERDRDDPAGARWLESAVETDPKSPWPHLFVAMFALERGEWDRGMRALKDCVRADPDTGFFVLANGGVYMLADWSDDPKHPGARAALEFIEELIAIRPDHPGGYDVLGGFHRQTGDHRAALAAYARSRRLASPDYPPRAFGDTEILQLEAEARWEEKLPAVLRGEITPAGAIEVRELAAYCATFEKKFALATRLVLAAAQSDPKVLAEWTDVVRYAGWAAQAGAGNGADGGTLPLIVREQYRRQALRWMRGLLKEQPKDIAASMGYFVNTVRDFAPVRDPKELTKLPAAERAEWEELWVAFTPPAEPGKPRKREVAPPPRAANEPADLPAEK